jgi:hypothetical protein
LYPQLSGDWLLTGSGFMLKAANSLKNQSELLTKEKALTIAVDGLNDLQDQLLQLKKEISRLTPKQKQQKPVQNKYPKIG